MRTFLAIILFPIVWVTSYVIRFLVFGIIFGIVYLIHGLFNGFISFLIQLIYLPFNLLIDLILGLVFAFMDALQISKNVARKRYQKGEFARACKRNRFKMYKDDKDAIEVEVVENE